MSTLPRQTANTAFRSQAYATQAALPNRRPLPAAPPSPARSQPVPAVSPRHRVQTGWLLTLVVVALLVVSAGMIYLSGHARVTEEGYRRTRLLSMIKKENNLQQQWQQRKALTVTPAHIEQKARALGMVPTEEKQVVTVGETTAAQLQQQTAPLPSAVIAPASMPSVTPTVND